MIDVFLEKEWLINFISFTIMIITLVINPEGKLKILSLLFVLSFSVLTFSVFLNCIAKGF